MLLKMEKDGCKNIQENWKLVMKKVGFISFIIFVLKTTSMYFDLTYYYYGYTKLNFFFGCAYEKAEMLSGS